MVAYITQIPLTSQWFSNCPLNNFNFSKWLKNVLQSQEHFLSHIFIHASLLLLSSFLPSLLAIFPTHLAHICWMFALCQALCQTLIYSPELSKNGPRLLEFMALWERQINPVTLKNILVSYTSTPFCLYHFSSLAFKCYSSSMARLK